MMPMLIGNPLIAWLDDSTLVVGWGAHMVKVPGAPKGLAQWLPMINGGRSHRALIAAAGTFGIPEAVAAQVLSDLEAAGLLDSAAAPAVALHRTGLLDAPLCRALQDAGVQVCATSDVVVYPLGQVPSLVAAPRSARRLVPVWFTVRAVHVGPVLDDTAGPCPRCIDRHWAAAQPGWSTLVSQAGSVPTWHEPAQLVLAAGAIAHIADAASTVGLEMIFDPVRPGPSWRVWQPHPGCECQQSPQVAKGA